MTELAQRFGHFPLGAISYISLWMEKKDYIKCNQIRNWNKEFAPVLLFICNRLSFAAMFVKIILFKQEITTWYQKTSWNMPLLWDLADCRIGLVAIVTWIENCSNTVCASVQLATEKSTFHQEIPPMKEPCCCC